MKTKKMEWKRTNMNYAVRQIAFITDAAHDMKQTNAGLESGARFER